MPWPMPFMPLNYPALSKMFKTHGKIEVDNLQWENSARKVKEVYDLALQSVHV
jgi:hypothetical protein